MKSQIFLLFTLTVFLCVPTSSHSHDPSSNIYVVHSQDYDALVEHLEEFIENSKQYSSPVVSDSEKKIGEELLNKSFEHFKEMIELRGEHSLTDKILIYLKTEVLSKLNPIRLGKEVLELARRVGPRFAITTVSIEVLENLTYVLAAYDPTYSFLVPVVFFHGYDAIGFTYIFGVPFALERRGVYKRFGGYKTGPKEFYHFLVNQKNYLPVDWSVTVDLQRITLPTKDTQIEIELVILKKNFLEKLISGKYKTLIFPRRTAQRSTSNALSLSDLEAIAKTLGINLFTYRGLQKDPPVYSRFLVRDILQNANGSTYIANKLKDNNQGKIFNGELKDSSFNAVHILKAQNSRDLSLIGESPDILAQRLMWYILNEAEEIKLAKETQKIDYKLLRKIVAIANKDFKRISETDYSGNTEMGFKELYKSISEVKQLIEQFISKPKICRELLSLIY